MSCLFSGPIVVMSFCYVSLASLLMPVIKVCYVFSQFVPCFCLWTGNKPPSTLSCSFWRKWFLCWLIANLDLQPVLHVSFISDSLVSYHEVYHFTMIWPLFRIWCFDVFFAHSYARCTRSVSIGEHYCILKTMCSAHKLKAVCFHQPNLSSL